MPAGRMYSTKSNYAKKIQRSWRRRKKRKNKSLSKRVSVLAKKVYANTQNNWIDTTTPQTSSVSVGSISYGGFLGLQAILKGVNGHDERIGDVITLKKASMRFLFDQSTTDTYNYQRVIIGYIEDVPTPGTLPGVADFLEISNVQSFYKKGGDVKWKLLKDFTVLTTLNSQPGCVTKRDINIDFKGLKIHYRPASTNVIRNLPFMLTISDSGNIDHPRFSIITRLHFEP